MSYRYKQKIYRKFHKLETEMGELSSQRLQIADIATEELLISTLSLRTVIFNFCSQSKAVQDEKSAPHEMNISHCQFATTREITMELFSIVSC